MNSILSTSTHEFLQRVESLHITVFVNGCLSLMVVNDSRKYAVSHGYRFVGTVVLTLLVSVAGCKVQEDITTYLVAASDGSVDTALIHGKGGNKIVREEFTLYSTFRQMREGNATFSMTLLIESNTGELTDIQVTNVQLVEVHGQDLKIPREIPLSSLSKPRRTDGGCYQVRVIDLSDYATASRIRMRVILTGTKEGSTVSREVELPFTRTTVTIPVSSV